MTDELEKQLRGAIAELEAQLDEARSDAELRQAELVDARHAGQLSDSDGEVKAAEVTRLQGEAAKFEKWWNDAKEENVRLIAAHADFKNRRNLSAGP